MCYFKHTRDCINVFERNVKNLLTNSSFVWCDVRASNVRSFDEDSSGYFFLKQHEGFRYAGLDYELNFVLNFECI